MNLFKFFRKHGKKIIFFLCLFFFFLLLYLLIKEKLSTFDLFIYNKVIYYKSETMTTIFLFLSYLCSTFYLMFLILLCFFFFKEKKFGFYIAGNTFLCYAFNLFLKAIIKRPRPSYVHLAIEKGYSFPSGHAMVSLAFFGLFIYLILQSTWKKKYKIIASFFLSVLIFSIGLSRIYLGVHYASDVLAGFSISCTYLILFTSLLNLKFKNTKQ